MRIRIKVFLGGLTLLGEKSGQIHLYEVSLRGRRETSGERKDKDEEKE